MKFAVVILLLLGLGAASVNSTFTCTCQNCFLRNPTDPHKYIECVNGQPYEFTCPAGLVFNESIQACDYTTGPDVTHPTEGTVTVPTGHRSRHTDATRVTQPGTRPPTEATRGTHGHHEEITTQSHHEEVSTRGRHGGGH